MLSLILKPPYCLCGAQSSQPPQLPSACLSIRGNGDSLGACGVDGLETGRSPQTGCEEPKGNARRAQERGLLWEYVSCGVTVKNTWLLGCGAVAAERWSGRKRGTCVCAVDRDLLDGIENGGREDVHAAVDAVAHLTRRGQRTEAEVTGGRWQVAGTESREEHSHEEEV